MAIGRPDYFSLPTTPKYGTSLLWFHEGANSDAGVAVTRTKTFTGVLRQLFIQAERTDKDVADLFMLYVDDELILYGFDSLIEDPTDHRWLGNYCRVVKHNELDGLCSFLFEREVSVISHVDLIMGSDATQTRCAWNIVGWYDEIEG
jgi:hypothetical protein